MVEEGEKISLSISDLNHRGEGVGKCNHFTVFVPKAVPGDEILVEITALHQNFARANPLQWITLSSQRTTPACALHHSCGGCQLQHLNYPSQLLWKQKRLQNTLKKIGNIDIPVYPLLGMNYPYRYRNQARIHLNYKGGNVNAGFYQENTHQIVNLEDCLIQHQNNIAVMISLRQTLQELIDKAELKKRHYQYLPTSATIRTSFSSSRTVLSLEIPHHQTARDIASTIAYQIKNRTELLAGIVTCEKKGRSGIYQTVWGESELKEILDELTFLFSPSSFFQVNPLQAGQMYKKAAECAIRANTAFDIYCGVGTLSLFLADKYLKVIGVESNPQAVESAVKNAQNNNKPNVHFLNAKAEKVFSSLIKEKTTKSMVVDPPRKGCSKGLLKTITEAKPEGLVYISCEPSTLARDLKYLNHMGYSPQVVYPIDMFPHTTHVESVVPIVPS